jgi:hypothetical protein
MCGSFYAENYMLFILFKIVFESILNVIEEKNIGLNVI